MISRQRIKNTISRAKLREPRVMANAMYIMGRVSCWTHVVNWRKRGIMYTTNNKENSLKWMLTLKSVARYTAIMQ
jgi:hypothetical protein